MKERASPIREKKKAKTENEKGAKGEHGETEKRERER
jgi:hypothetical protein